MHYRWIARQKVSKIQLSQDKEKNTLYSGKVKKAAIVDFCGYGHGLSSKVSL